MKLKLLTLPLACLSLMFVLNTAEAQPKPQTKPPVKQAVKQPTAAEKATKVAKQQQERRAKLTQEYGLSMQQVMRVESLNKEKKAKFDVLKKSNLSQEEKKARHTAIVDSHNNQLKTVFTPSQYAKYEANITKLVQKNQQKHELLKSYKKELSNIKKLPSSQRTQAKESLDRQYIANLSVYLDPKVAKHEITKIDITRKSRSSDIKILKLSKEKALEMGKLKRNYAMRLDNLKKQNLPDKERRDKRKAIETNYQNRVKELVGEQKYNQWTAYNNGSHQRHYMKVFGFTKEHYDKYKEIETKLAIEQMKIKRSAIPPAEKQTKIAAAKSAKVESLRALLPAQQFGKWYNSFSASEAKRQFKSSKKI